MAAENENRPKNVGILAMDIYFPPTYVKLDGLEDYDRVRKGKYTTGLGQESLSFCSEVEDVISMSLTVVSSLLKKYSINPKQIGWMEVGSDTIIDRSKSIKTFLMQLFMGCHNTDIEGVDSTSGSYGVTAALFNCVNWVESSSWDGRYGLVICSDSVLYDAEEARPLEGAAAIAMLIGPAAPIVFESKLRASYMAHAYDFYKPKNASDKPVMDARFLHFCRMRALDSCYELFCSKYENLWGKQFSIDDAAYFVLHSMFNLQLQQSFARLVFKDVVRNASSVDEGGKKKLECFTKLSAFESYQSKDLEKASLEVAMPLYDAKVQPSTLLPKKVGNMGNASVYAAFISLLHNKHSELNGKWVVIFSYGSGVTASMFSVRLFDGGHQFNLSNIAAMMDVDGKLKARSEVTPADFTKMMKNKISEQFCGARSFETDKNYCSLLPADAFYLSRVDHKWRRIYLKNSAKRKRVLE